MASHAKLAGVTRSTLVVTSAMVTGALALGILLCGAPPARALPPDGAAARVEHVILDIVSFTRWPKPMALLRLCALGPSAYSGGFADTTLNAGGLPVRTRQVRLEDAHLGEQCDIVYEGALTRQERESLVRDIVGHPVLTVGESVPGCTGTTMFCLELAGLPVSDLQAGEPRIPFSSNLDAIARSGVRLNPRVLLLGRSGRAAP